MAYFHHGSIRKYTAALLDFFNSVEIQYRVTTGETLSKAVPLKYSSVEKSRMFDEYTTEQILSGNFGVLPRASLSLVSMGKAEQRVQNKNTKIGKFTSDTTMEYMYNSVPYEFTFDIVFQCRGMNEATQIIEQIAPKFNPTVNIDIWDASNLDEPTRVPVSLVDIQMEQEEYDELSSNIITITFSLSLQGNLYPPIKSQPRVQEFQIYLNQIENDTSATRKEMMEWDVDLYGNIMDKGLDLYTEELTNGGVGTCGFNYDGNDVKVGMWADRVIVENMEDIFVSTDVQGILEEIYAGINQANGFLQLDETGLLDIDPSLIPGANIDGYVKSIPELSDGTVTVVQLARLDHRMATMNLLDVAYNTSLYSLVGDSNRPPTKIAYILYENNHVAAYAYNHLDKIARIDYYTDINNFVSDGSGRDAYSTFTYNSDGKMLSLTYTEVNVV